MGFFDSFPYSNQHTLNLDWLIKKQRELEEYIKQYTAVNHVAYAGVWDITKQYPQWAVVSNGDKSYMSNKPVPAGIPIDNKEYWLHLADLDPRIGGIIAELDTLTKQLENGDYSTKAVYPSPRQAFTISNQAEFMEYMELFRHGYTSRNAEIVAPGEYKIDFGSPKAIFNGVQMHITPLVSGVVIDLNGSIFYNGHFNFNASSGNTMVIKSTGTDIPYFEDSSVFANYVQFETVLRLWSGWAYLSQCTFTRTQDTTFLDVIGGKCSLNYCGFEAPNSGASCIGMGNGGFLETLSRITIRSPEAVAGSYFITSRQSSAGICRILWTGSVYNPETGGSYSSANRGKFDAVFRPSMAIDVLSVDDKLHYLANAAGVVYPRCSYQKFESVTGL